MADNDTVASDTVNEYRKKQALEDTKVKPPAKPKQSDAEESVKNDMLAGEMAHPSGKKAPAKVYKKGGAVKSGASRGDGIAERGRTRGKYC